MHDLQGKRALVTGGSSGIGAQAAVRLAEAGAAVAIAGRDRDRLAATAARARAAGGRVAVVSAELTSDAGPATVVAEAIAAFGGLDIVVLSAAVFRPQPLAQTSDEDLDVTWATNVRAPYRVVRAALPHLRASRGTVVFVSSVSARAGFTGDSAYAASKAALEGLTRALSVELGPQGIRVNCVAPGLTATPMNAEFRGDAALLGRAVEATPAGRIGAPEEIADAVVFLASPAARYVHGVTLAVDGGYPAAAIQLDFASQEGAPGA